MSKKNVVILGSTGTIGVNTLKVIRRYPQKFNVVGLTAYSNSKLLLKQVEEFSPSHVAVGEKYIAWFKSNSRKRNLKVLSAETEIEEIVSLNKVDVVIIGMRGSGALSPFLRAVRCGKIVAPANKEALVIAGDIIMKEAKRCGATVVPIDSEQSAIFQCLDRQNRDELRKVYLTASGGVLLNVPRSKFDKLTVKQILDHPRWKMGQKITVDSATLMNKGFEIIEAIRLFDLKVSDIEVVIHPEAIIHSMVEYTDGSILAQLGVTDMRLPIQYALTYPQRLKTGLKRLDFFELKQLNFLKPDYGKFPALDLAVSVAKRSGTVPSVLNASDEEAVDAFLSGEISFSSIFKTVEKVVLSHKNVKKPKLKDIIEADQWARIETRKVICN